MTNQIIALALLILISITSSKSQVPVAEAPFEISKQAIYDTCNTHVSKRPPSGFYFGVDNSSYELSLSPDSVLYAWIRGGIDDSQEPPYSAYRLNELHSCKNLGFLVYEHSSISTKSWSYKLDFTNFPELRYVHSDHIMSASQLEGLLSTAKKLKGLELKLNVTIPECICELKELRYLIITNYGTSLPACMRDMPNLKYLELNGGGVGLGGSINDVIFNIPSLELLRIDGGKHVDIPSSVSELKRLKQLAISSIDSLTIAPEFTNLDSLELLEISWVDKMITLPENFKNLKSLRGIKIAQVRLDHIPDLSEHEKLKYLAIQSVGEINDNSLNFTNMPSLQYLYLRGVFQDIDSFPKGISTLDSLVTLNLQGFNIQILPDYLKNLENLKHLSLIGSPLELNSYLSIYSEHYDNLRSFAGSYNFEEYDYEENQEYDRVHEKIVNAKKKRGKRRGYLQNRESANDFLQTFEYYKYTLKYEIDYQKFISNLELN